MSYLAKVRVRVEKDIITRIKRILGGKGEFSINIGQEVTPEEIIGTSTVSSGFRTLNLSSLLSVRPGDASKYLTKKLGQRVYKDELLAYKKGGFFNPKKVVTAPTDGLIDFLNDKTGELRMTFMPKKNDLPAGVYGVVEAIDKQRGETIIGTQVSRVHGIFGSGKSRDGILHILSRKDELVSKSEILPTFDQRILVGGSLFFKDAISAAISIGVNGIITGGMNAKDYKGMAGGKLVFPKKLENDIGISLVVCEGFGSVAVGEDIFEILSAYEGRFVSVDGNKAFINLPSYSSSSLTKIKSTQLPPIQNSDVILDDEHISEVLELKIGSKVRIIGNSYFGEQGNIVQIDDSLTLLPSKIRTFLVTVETSRRKIQVPVANLELIL